MKLFDLFLEILVVVKRILGNIYVALASLVLSHVGLGLDLHANQGLETMFGTYILIGLRSSFLHSMLRNPHVEVEDSLRAGA
ncbi:hypothetical protein L1049_013983 [Liquidambar formosana]|uniref:Uncharacterized protein n=1 Tax=Liquidambar formosana TaxID=63359 RepID=A0AAP0RQ73_LIQFO